MLLTDIRETFGSNFGRDIIMVFLRPYRNMSGHFLTIRQWLSHSTFNALQSDVLTVSLNKVQINKNILWRIEPLLGNDSKTKFPRDPTLTTIESVFSECSVQSGYKEVFSSRSRCKVESYVGNWVEFWRWQSKAIENKWQERNYAMKRSHVWFEVTVRRL
jgi:hypothetical protein